MSTGANVLSFRETVSTRRTMRRVGLFRRRKLVVRQQSIWNIQVDGALLQELIRDWSGVPDMPAEMADLRSAFPAAGLLRIDHLLGLDYGQSPSHGDALSAGCMKKVGLLFCPICRGEGCGYLACDLRVDGHHVIWDGFRWEDTVDGKPRTTPVSGAQPLRFEREPYRAALMDLRSQIVIPGGASGLIGNTLGEAHAAAG